MCGLLDGDHRRADVLVMPIIKTFMSSSLNAPRIETAQLDEVQTKRLDLRQHAVERGPIQNTVSNVSSPFSWDTVDSKADRAVGPRWPEIRIEYRLATCWST